MANEDPNEGNKDEHNEGDDPPKPQAVLDLQVIASVIDGMLNVIEADENELLPEQNEGEHKDDTFTTTETDILPAHREHEEDTPRNTIDKSAKEDSVEEMDAAEVGPIGGTANALIADSKHKKHKEDCTLLPVTHAGVSGVTRNKGKEGWNPPANSPVSPEVEDKNTIEPAPQSSDTAVTNTMCSGADREPKEEERLPDQEKSEGCAVNAVGLDSDAPPQNADEVEPSPLNAVSSAVGGEVFGDTESRKMSKDDESTHTDSPNPADGGSIDVTAESSEFGGGKNRKRRRKRGKKRNKKRSEDNEMHHMMALSASDMEEEGSKEKKRRENDEDGDEDQQKDDTTTNTQDRSEEAEEGKQRSGRKRSNDDEDDETRQQKKEMKLDEAEAEHGDEKDDIGTSQEAEEDSASATRDEHITPPPNHGGPRSSVLMNGPTWAEMHPQAEMRAQPSTSEGFQDQRAQTEPVQNSPQVAPVAMPSHSAPPPASWRPSTLCFNRNAAVVSSNAPRSADYRRNTDEENLRLAIQRSLEDQGRRPAADQGEAAENEATIEDYDRVVCDNDGGEEDEIYELLSDDEIEGGDLEEEYMEEEEEEEEERPDPRAAVEEPAAEQDQAAAIREAHIEALIKALEECTDGRAKVELEKMLNNIIN